MKQTFLIKFALVISIIGFLFSCSDNNQFTIKGFIKDGNEKILYFENVTATKVFLLDSMKLGKDGSYKFMHKRPEAPDFFRLRLNNQFINFSIDSVEIVTINSDTLNFAKDYSIEGSIESEYIRSLTMLQLKTSETFNKIQKQYFSKIITADEYTKEANLCIEVYKNEAKNHILNNLSSASAYFALFQQINGMLLFDPYDKNDSKIFGAVANSWNQRYPEAFRTKHLVSLFTSTLSIIRKEQTGDLIPKNIESKDFFDITLLSYNNNEYRLSETGKNKVVLLDFIVYEMKESPLHNQQLAEIYRKFYSKGFEIYQISLDMDLHFWKNAASNLPWICVIDPQSINSPIVRKYNVDKLPAGFIFDRNGEIVKRVEDYGKLENDILTYF